MRLACTLALILAFAAGPSAPPDDEVFFSPPAPGQPITAEAAIVREIGRARYSVLVQAYSFTSLPIAEALVGAHRAGRRIEVVVDPTDDTPRNLVVPILLAAGIQVRVDRSHAISHNKLVILDEELFGEITVLNGSYNFTAAARTRNAENLRITRRDPLGPAYVANWRRHAAHAGAVVGR